MTTYNYPRRISLVYMWAFAIIAPVFVGGGWLVVSSLFPLDVAATEPVSTAQQVADYYKQNAEWISLGSVLVLVGTIICYPYVAVVASQLKRIEEANNEKPLNSWVFLVSGTMAWGYGSLAPCLAWIAAAYRPDRNPEITQAFNDLAFFSFFMPFPPFAIMVIVLGVAILRDQTTSPLFPRWFGWLCIWEIFATVPPCLAALYKTGPFAWNGLMGFWVPTIAGLSLFIGGSVFYTIRAIMRDDQYDTQLKTV